MAPGPAPARDPAAAATPASSPSSARTAQNVSVEERCRYPSKFCSNRRARKSNGDMHRFCDFHRRKANLNQKRWNRMRRFHSLMVGEDGKHIPPPSLRDLRSPNSPHAVDALDDMPLSPVAIKLEESLPPVNTSWSQQDIDLLGEILFDDMPGTDSTMAPLTIYAPAFDVTWCSPHPISSIAI
ncbi:hypothetical protein P43SY_008393 [Pythium insidiosum]|uniref:Uncharacterized protein n=1 Tax=Pythium insidiosum TaxID=114742 RepID=A0AAD5QAJ7_PYTIN|nr:hypothetical protein P43SY_008393 [Pythium insidiosum]